VRISSQKDILVRKNLNFAITTILRQRYMKKMIV